MLIQRGTNLRRTEIAVVVFILQQFTGQGFVSQCGCSPLPADDETDKDSQILLDSTRLSDSDSMPSNTTSHHQLLHGPGFLLECASLTPLVDEICSSQEECFNQSFCSPWLVLGRTSTSRIRKLMASSQVSCSSTSSSAVLGRQ